MKWGFFAGVIEGIRLYCRVIEGDGMNMEDEKTPGQAGAGQDKEALERLRQLKQKLRLGDISPARRAAYNLSWLQEDGLAILSETLTGDFSKTAKKAAGYGLRSMRGRMKKMAVEVLEQGVNNSDRTTKAVCVKALALMRGEVVAESRPPEKRKRRRPRIQGIRQKGKKSTQRRRASYNR